MWVSGSARASATFRSISVLPPRISTSTSFPSSLASAPTMGWNESNNGRSGTIRMAMISDRSSSRFCDSDVATTLSRRFSSDRWVPTSWNAAFPSSTKGATLRANAGENSPWARPSWTAASRDAAVRR